MFCTEPKSANLMKMRTLYSRNFFAVIDFEVNIKKNKHINIANIAYDMVVKYCFNMSLWHVYVLLSTL